MNAVGASRPRADASTVVISDVRICGDAVGAALAREARIQVLGTFAADESLLRQIGVLRPQVAVVDASAADAVTFVGDLARVAPGVKVVVLGVEDIERDILRYAEAGVSALVLRDASVHDLAATIRSIVEGEWRCDPRVTAVLLRRVAALARVSDADAFPTELTFREREIAEMVARGLSNKEIARELSVAVSTVKAHVHNLLEKLDVTRRTEVGARLQAPRHVTAGRALDKQDLGPFPDRF